MPKTWAEGPEIGRVDINAFGGVAYILGMLKAKDEEGRVGEIQEQFCELLFGLATLEAMFVGYGLQAEKKAVVGVAEALEHVRADFERDVAEAGRKANGQP